MTQEPPSKELVPLRRGELVPLEDSPRWMESELTLFASKLFTENNPEELAEQHEITTPPTVEEALRDQLEADDKRTRWLDNPVTWAIERGKVREVWDGQEKIMYAVAHNRRVAVRSCHAIGKTFTAAMVTAWWIDAHPPGEAFVVTTAPTSPQVKAQLWREINRVHRAGDLSGRTNLTEWYVGNELVAFGRKPSEHNPSGFVGMHARYILVILDEACGIPSSLWIAAEAVASTQNGHILAIGNPDMNTGDFFEVAHNPDWVSFEIGYQDVVNANISDELREVLISEEWVEEMARRWGRDSALFYSKCLGKFPLIGGDPWIIVPLNFVTPCRYLELPSGGTEPLEAGVDVGAGGDRTSVVTRRGQRVEEIEAFVSADPVASTGRIALFLDERGVDKVRVDVIGVGWNVYGRLKELSRVHNPGSPEACHDAEVIAVDTRRKSKRPRRYLNLRAELWWDVARERSRLGTWDLGVLDDNAVAELTIVRYDILDSTGKIKVESKDEIIKRLGRSPDVADALIMAFYTGMDTADANTDAVGTFAGRSLTNGGGGTASPFRSNGNGGGGSRVFAGR